jgi:hypothetical protein
MTTPPPDATLLTLTMPLFMSAGPVQGTALVLARSGVDLYYLVDNAAAEGPPVWVAEGEIEKCMLMSFDDARAAGRPG